MGGARVCTAPPPPTAGPGADPLGAERSPLGRGALSARPMQAGRARPEQMALGSQGKVPLATGKRVGGPLAFQRDVARSRSPGEETGDCSKSPADALNFLYFETLENLSL